MFVGKSKQRYSEYEPSNAAPLGCGKAAYADCQSKYEIKVNLSNFYCRSPARQTITYFVYWPIFAVPYLVLWQFISHLFVWISLQLQRNREARLICTTPFVYDSFWYVKVPSWMSKTRTATLPSMSLSDTTRCHNYDSYRICKMSAR